MPPQPVLQRRHYVFALSVAGSVRPVLSPVPTIFLALSKNTERISMKFVGGNHYHEQIKFWAKLEQEQENRIRQNIQVDVNRFCRSVKLVLAPSE